MGFFAYSIKEPKKWPTNDPKVPIDRIPMFLFPGILGNGTTEFKNLIQELQRQYPLRNIYVYNDLHFSQDPEIEGASKITDDKTSGERTEVKPYVEPEDLEEYAESVIKEMLLALPVGHIIPFVLVGYSFGGALAAKIGSLLQRTGCDIRLMIVDAPTPAATQAYFKNDVLPVHDLIAIIDYVSRVTPHTSFHPEKLNIEELELLDLEDCIDNIASALEINLTNTDEKTASNLDYLIYLVKRNLRYLLEEPGLELNFEKEESKLTCLLTQELVEKYGPTAGWEQYSPRLITNTTLLNLSHADLMTKHCDLLAEEFNAPLNILPIHLAINMLKPFADINLSDTEKLSLATRIITRKSPASSSPGNESADDEVTKPVSPASSRESASESENDSDESDDEKNVDGLNEDDIESEKEVEKEAKKKNNDDSDDEKERKDKRRRLYGLFHTTTKTTRNPDRTSASCPDLSEMTSRSRQPGQI